MIDRKDLKPGWRKVKFGDVVRQVKDKLDPDTSGLERYVAGEHMDTDDLRIRRWGEIGSGYLGPAFHMHFRPGQVLYGSRRTYLRKVAVPDFDGICANTTFVLEPKNTEELLPEFLPFLMQTDQFNEYSVKNSKGSVNPYINFSDLALFEFKLPRTEDQKKIVNLMIASEEFIEAIRVTESALKKVRSSLATEYFASPSRHKLKPCIELIESGSLTLQTGPFGTVLKAAAYKSYGHPIINPVNMKDGALKIDDGPFVGDEDWTRLDKYWMKNGDMVIGRKGNMSNLIFVRPEYDGFLVGSDCIRFRVDPDVINQRYFFHFLRSETTQNWIQGQAYGTVMPGINEKILSRLLAYIPLLDEQKHIADEFDEIENSLSQNAARLEESRNLKSALLRTALRSGGFDV